METTTETNFKGNIFGLGSSKTGVSSSEYDKAMKDIKKPRPRYTGKKEVVATQDVREQLVRSEEVTPHVFDLGKPDELEGWKKLCKEKADAAFKRFSYLERKYCEATGNWKIYVEVAELIIIDAKSMSKRSE